MNPQVCLFVMLVLFFLANAGVAWLGSGVWDRNSTAVFMGFGKTSEILVFTLIGCVFLKLSRGGVLLPSNVEIGEQRVWRDIPFVGLLGARGITVALFVADAAGSHASLKLGALASLSYLGIAVLLGKLLDRNKTTLTSHIETEYGNRD